MFDFITAIPLFLSHPACIACVDPVAHKKRIRARTWMGISVQLSSGVLVTPSAASSEGETIEVHEESVSLTLESIRFELGSLWFQQAELQERIYHVRRALCELVHVFGPEILVRDGARPEIASEALSRNATPTIMDFVRMAVSRSTQWVSLDELVTTIRKESPTTLARFMLPGVAVSNALRALHRRGEVERSTDLQSAKWRWTGG